MMKRQAALDRGDTAQTKGTRNGRGRDGSVYRSTSTPMLTRMNADNVPMLVRS